MKKILSAVVTVLAAMSFSTSVFATDAAKPVVPAGPIYATVPAVEVQNEAAKAAKAREKTVVKEADSRAEVEAKDARDAKAKADTKASEAKAKSKALANTH
jgi:hypothetical protein